MCVAAWYNFLTKPMAAHICIFCFKFCTQPSVQQKFVQKPGLQTPGDKIQKINRFHWHVAYVTAFVPQCVFHGFCLANREKLKLSVFGVFLCIVFCISNEALPTSGGWRDGLNPNMHHATPASNDRAFNTPWAIEIWRILNLKFEEYTHKGKPYKIGLGFSVTRWNHQNHLKLKNIDINWIQTVTFWDFSIFSVFENCNLVGISYAFGPGAISVCSTLSVCRG